MSFQTISPNNKNKMWAPIYFSSEFMKVTAKYKMNSFRLNMERKI